MHTVSRKIGEKDLILETGRVAKQAHGAVLVRYGDTQVLVTAVQADPREGISFFPLTCEYREMMYAAGRFPGGFFKREGRPSQKETLTSRLIDRPVRPRFPKGFNDEIQVIATVLSADKAYTVQLSNVVGKFARARTSGYSAGTVTATVYVSSVR